MSELSDELLKTQRGGALTDQQRRLRILLLSSGLDDKRREVICVDRLGEEGVGASAHRLHCFRNPPMTCEHKR